MKTSTPRERRELFDRIKDFIQQTKEEKRKKQETEQRERTLRFYSFMDKYKALFDNKSA
jgi:hypothetical protein